MLPYPNLSAPLRYGKVGRRRMPASTERVNVETMKLLVIEDDQKIAGYVAKGFRESGDSVDIQSNGHDGLTMATMTC